jgi:hypothetical protein
MFILSNKLHAISLALIVACPVCCCFGDWLQQFVLPDGTLPFCCSGSEMDDTPEDSSDGCACKAFEVARAKSDLSFSPSPQGFPGSSILASILSLETVFPRLFSEGVPPSGLPLFSIPPRIVFQTFLI